MLYPGIFNFPKTSGFIGLLKSITNNGSIVLYVTKYTLSPKNLDEYIFSPSANLSVSPIFFIFLSNITTLEPSSSYKATLKLSLYSSIEN